ncbi:hypothetical protein OG241_47690 [Streptomyces sp. NBC_01390]|uniref:hypothetical protein n=1 Tax=Streptomyces sp. NBC_01390 TaxID=2903850 RepID=UPI0032503C03
MGRVGAAGAKSSYANPDPSGPLTTRSASHSMGHVRIWERSHGTRAPTSPEELQT